MTTPQNTEPGPGGQSGLSPAEMRQMLIAFANHQSLDVYEGYQASAAKCVRFAREKQWLADVVSKLGLGEEECRTELRIICREVSEPKDDEDSRLVETAAQFIEAEYKKGKYDGREAVGFFRTLFERVSCQLLLKLDEAIS